MNNINESKITIGELIENEVRKQNLTMDQFAQKICCQRANVYKIFKRNTIDILQLKRISEVLKHNYFEDLAKNVDLARPVPVDEDELERLRAINQFLEVVPKVFQKLGYTVSFVFGTKMPEEENVPLPDFILSDFNISFTIGQTYEEKCNGVFGKFMFFHHPSEPCPSKMVGMLNQQTGIQSFDIAIDYKTEEEWEETIRFALNEIDSFYLPRTWGFLRESRKGQRNSAL